MKNIYVVDSDRLTLAFKKKSKFYLYDLSYTTPSICENNLILRNNIARMLHEAQDLRFNEITNT